VPTCLRVFAFAFGFGSGLALAIIRTASSNFMGYRVSFGS